MVRHRQALGVSVTGLAKQLSAQGLPFHPQTVQRIEAGERPVRLNEAVLIVQALQMSADGSVGLDAAVSDSRVTRILTLRRVLESAEEHLLEAHRVFDRNAARAVELGSALHQALAEAELEPGDDVLKWVCEEVLAELGAFVDVHGALRASERG